MNRWSNVTLTFIVLPTTTAPFSTTGRVVDGAERDQHRQPSIVDERRVGHVEAQRADVGDHHAAEGVLGNPEEAHVEIERVGEETTSYVKTQGRRKVGHAPHDLAGSLESGILVGSYQLDLLLKLVADLGERLLLDFVHDETGEIDAFRSIVDDRHLENTPTLFRR